MLISISFVGGRHTAPSAQIVPYVPCARLSQRVAPPSSHYHLHGQSHSGFLSVLSMSRLVWVLAASLVFGSTQVPLHVRSAQSAAVCLGDYAWADNSKNDSPCQLAADVNGACHGGNWEIPALDINHHYDNPNSTSADLCSCSWLAYNLIGACAACQGFQNLIQGWSPYKLACVTAAKLSSTYFPNDQIALPDGITIPVWAAVDPSQWTDQTFDPSQAKRLANEASPDIVPSAPAPDTQKSSTPVGAIAGGVAGGVVALLLAAGLAFIVRRRRKQQAPTSTNGHVDKPSDLGHGRTISDFSQTTVAAGMGLGYKSFSPTQPPLLQTNGTPHTRANSVNSLSYFGSAAGSMVYPASSAGLSISSPISPSSPASPEDIIVPYMVPQSVTAPRQASDRKRADGVVSLMYDNPMAPPVHVDESIASRRPRYNPPEYTPYAGTGPEDSSSQTNGSSSRTNPPHSRGNSADTKVSWDSGTGNTSVVARRGHGTGAGSVSALGDVIEQEDYVDSPENEHSSSVLSGGGSMANARNGGGSDVAM